MNSAFECLQLTSFFFKIGFTQCIQSDLRQSRGQVEDRIHHAIRTLLILGDVLWLDEYSHGLLWFIDEVLCETLKCYTYVYLVDILIFRRSLEEHTVRVCQVLQLLLQNHFYVKLEKSQFQVTMISFLGFVVSQGSLSMDLAKIKVVTEWPQPTSV